uniref:Uncharacterized protein n=1 Tax=Anguilla anguilla TaxID=7936 RepID=A0A0E9UU80_ANGAN
MVAYRHTEGHVANKRLLSVIRSAPPTHCSVN